MQTKGGRDAAEEASPWVKNRAPVIFEARLAPRRSLPPSGFLLVMLVAGGFAAAIGISVWRAGAWPVIGFGGLDILGLYLGLRLSYAHARLYEHVRLTADELAVERVWPGGRHQHWRLQPFWTRVEIEGSQEAGSRLALVCRGQRVVLGSFLSPAERMTIAEDLAAALKRRH